MQVFLLTLLKETCHTFLAQIISLELLVLSHELPSSLIALQLHVRLRSIGLCNSDRVSLHLLLFSAALDGSCLIGDCSH